METIPVNVVPLNEFELNGTDYPVSREILETMRDPKERKKRDYSDVKTREDERDRREKFDQDVE